MCVNFLEIDFDFVGLGWGLRFFGFNKFSGEDVVVGSWIIFLIVRYQEVLESIDGFKEGECRVIDFWQVFSEC